MLENILNFVIVEILCVPLFHVSVLVTACLLYSLYCMCRLHHCMVRHWLKFGLHTDILHEETLYPKASNVSGTSPTFSLQSELIVTVITEEKSPNPHYLLTHRNGQLYSEIPVYPHKGLI